MYSTNVRDIVVPSKHKPSTMEYPKASSSPEFSKINLDRLSQMRGAAECTDLMFIYFWTTVVVNIEIE